MTRDFSGIQGDPLKMTTIINLITLQKVQPDGERSKYMAMNSTNHGDFYHFAFIIIGRRMKECIMV